MQDTHVEKKKDYAAGIGIILPLIDMHTSGEVQLANANLSAKNQEVESEKQYLGEMNAKYDAIINASKVRLNHLDGELSLANQAYKTAKDRYFSLQGELLDLREAFRNLARVQTEIQETRLRFLQASGSKALLNGG
jgi:outer membrane protein TolC